MSEELIELPGPQISYTQLIDEAMVKEIEQKPYFPLRPSAAGYCGRRLAYDLMQYRGYAEYPKEQRSPETLRLLALGSSVEYHALKNLDYITKVNPEFKVKYKQQVVELFRLDPVDSTAIPELIEGSIDFAVFHTNTGGIGDIKSAKDKFSQSFKTAWDENIDKFNRMSTLIQISETGWFAPNLELFLDELNDPFFADNFHQVNSYCCTDWAKNHNIDHGFILRYSKNDSRHIEIRFNPSETVYLQFKDKCNRVNQAVAKKKPELVKKDYFLGSSRCAFCPYKDQCWGEDALKAFFKTLPNKSWPTDLNKLPDYGNDLRELFSTYEKDSIIAREASKIETEIIKILTENEIKKIKLDNGNVYEIKYLKTPRPHFELRRSKV